MWQREAVAALYAVICSRTEACREASQPVYKRETEENIHGVDALKIVLPTGWRMKCAECMDTADFAGSFSGIKQYGYNWRTYLWSPYTIHLPHVRLLLNFSLRL